MTILTGWGTDAMACPFCTTAKTGNGYLAATLVLLVLPLAALGGFALWVRRLTKSQPQPADGEIETRQSSKPQPSRADTEQRFDP